MGPMEESWQNYERQRRRLNARLGLMVFALLPLPAILIAVGLSPLRMLLVVASLGMSIGILYPMWWRTKHNPLRASVVESANAADCLGLPAKWVSLRPRSDVVLVGGKQGRRMGCFGIRRCGRLAAFVLVFLRQESRAKPAIREAPGLKLTTLLLPVNSLR